LVRMPIEDAMRRFWVTARVRRPKLVKRRSNTSQNWELRITGTHYGYSEFAEM